jgi:hypothetical protein
MARDSKHRGDLPVTFDGERQRTIDVLSRHFAHDNLSLDELERRIERAYRATSVPALRDLTKDLPTEAPDAVLPRQESVPAAFALEEDRIFSIMAETKRRGLWRPPRLLNVWSIMSDTRLDFTEAELAPGVTEVRLHGVMTSVRIIVPPHVRVVIQPSAFMATVSDEPTAQPHVGSGAPVIRITGRLIMAELKVRVRRREVLSADGELLDSGETL